MKTKFYVIVALVFLLLGCGAGGGGGDSYVQPNQVTNNPTQTEQADSEFRDVTLEWQPNSESNLAGYRVFMRRDGLDYDYTNPEWETTDTDCTLYNLYRDTTYHFVVRAYDVDGNESGDSNEATLEQL
jgi:hypothetical protein